MASRRVTTNYERELEAQLQSVREFADGLKETFLYCREMGHNWRPYTAARYKDGGYERTLRCTRCRTKRFQEISPRGIITSSRYEHPEGYLSKGVGRIVGEGRGLLRLESMKRITAKTDTEE